MAWAWDTAVVVRVQNIYDLIKQFLLGKIGKSLLCVLLHYPPLPLLLQWVKPPAQWPMIVCEYIHPMYLIVFLPSA